MISKLNKSPNNETAKKNIEIAEKEIEKSYEDEEVRKEKEAVSKIKLNMKYFYSYAKRNSATPTGITKLVDDNGIVKHGKQDMCEIFQNQFLKSFSTPKSGFKDEDISNKDNLKANKMDFSIADIKSAIKDIPNKSAAGADGITPKILKQCADNIAEPIYYLWEKSMETGEIPDKCKHSLIVHIHKKKRKDKPENYRPISLTSQDENAEYV